MQVGVSSDLRERGQCWGSREMVGLDDLACLRVIVRLSLQGIVSLAHRLDFIRRVDVKVAQRQERIFDAPPRILTAPDPAGRVR